MKPTCCPLLVAAVLSLGATRAIAQGVEARDAEGRSLDAERTLERAIQLAGPSVAGLPVVLATKPPDGASDGVEAWLLRGQDERPRQIVVYGESETFRCASGVSRQDYQCLLKVASLIVHEAWHYRNGPEEARAYAAQIEFLVLHGGSSTMVSGVRRAQARIVAARRRADGAR